MDRLLLAVLSNAVLATMLAMAVAVVCRFIRQPSVRRFLWLLVLARLAVPPLVNLPVLSLPVWEESASPLALTEPERPLPTVRMERPPSVMMDATNAMPLDLPPRSEVIPKPNLIPSSTRPEVRAGHVLPNWRLVLLAAWAGGTLLVVMVTTSRAVLFARRLRHARPASEQLRRRAAAIAARYALRSWPEVRVVAGPISPALWAWGGRAYVLLPAKLLARLDSHEQDMLLAHELAHYRRRDHWCRWFEAAVLAVYWWLPVAWWARNRAMLAEEECCDAWVLWAFPGSQRAYTDTLLATVDFLLPSLSGAAPGATGLGLFPVLKRRLEMILHHRPRHRMTPRAVLVLAVVASVVLAFSPVTRAEKAPTASKPAAATKPAEEEASTTPTPIDKETTDALLKALQEFRTNQAAFVSSKQELLGLVLQLQSSEKAEQWSELPLHARKQMSRLRSFQLQDCKVGACWDRLSASRNEVEGRRTALTAADKHVFGDAANVYLNALQRKAEAKCEYHNALIDSIEMADLGDAIAQQMETLRAFLRLEAAIEGRDATHKVWQMIKARSEERAKDAPVQAEAQARNQYWNFQHIVEQCEADCAKHKPDDAS